MSRYPTTEMSPRKLLRLSVRQHYATLKYTLSFLLMMVVMKALALVALHPVSNTYCRLLIELSASLIIVYLFSAALLSAHQTLMGKPFSSWTEGFKKIWPQTRDMYAVLLIYVAGAIVIYEFTQLLVFLVAKFVHSAHPSTNTIIYAAGTVILILYIVMLYFSFPLAIVDKEKISRALYRSILLTEKNKFGIFFSISILGAIVLLLTPGMVHQYLLSVYHLDLVFDFVVLCVGAPIYFNFLLLLINDSKIIIGDQR